MIVVLMVVSANVGGMVYRSMYPFMKGRTRWSA
jgi:hypothetical protein